MRVGADRIDLSSRIPPEVPPGYVTRMAEKADFLPYVGRIPGIDGEFVEQAFKPGDECSATFLDGEPVSFCFVTRSRAPVTEQLEIRVPKGFRYVYKTWTHPDHRRRNLSAMGSYVRNFIHKRPFNERSISYVETHNYPSLLHTYRRPSERGLTMGYVGWLTWFGRQIPFASRGARRIGLEFVRNDDHRVRYYTN